MPCRYRDGCIAQGSAVVKPRQRDGAGVGAMRGRCRPLQYTTDSSPAKAPKKLPLGRSQSRVEAFRGTLRSSQQVAPSARIALSQATAGNASLCLQIGRQTRRDSRQVTFPIRSLNVPVAPLWYAVDIDIRGPNIRKKGEENEGKEGGSVHYGDPGWGGFGTSLDSHCPSSRGTRGSDHGVVLNGGCSRDDNTWGCDSGAVCADLSALRVLCSASRRRLQLDSPQDPSLHLLYQILRHVLRLSSSADVLLPVCIRLVIRLGSSRSSVNALRRLRSRDADSQGTHST
jgi:hypothetical protein